MTKHTLSATTKMEPNGRVMIPALIRKRLNIEPGVRFVIFIKNDQLVLADEQKEKLKAWENLRKKNSKYRWKPGEKMLSEELIEDRKKEAIREGYV
ncbi:hypothetical protein COS66_02050 [Candidatus Berkelbacteria bacterium CG06_land_8_20_14_3_00_43_10]|uniref:SpoVT-AbrB domain-containing protein n=1 Tax=Candidatus Berkelbacteria bacterium CG10_big_fil_rev_8_21_14_0_10_43_14 TaxID=1974515 RepID=A0A2M6R9D3_9BACT|nr:MAG: hypothetical protein COT79_00205 [Candidatus Berkelbacteria bacterium CG10_big_fil_rev_8_21_14_0_10_43_14]PIU87271.1 MAG: hypothetical protein COS66_02050 [Candidatus Berkelbacteria bacterium CG06_land_8_20_14_3_00_43_10]